MALFIKPGPFPPGGFVFNDPRTGKHFYGMDVDEVGQARRVIAFREANPRVFAPNESVHFELTRVIQEIRDQICAKHPHVCEDNIAQPPPPPGVQTMATPPWNPKCPKCGSEDWKPVYCPTCSGQKITHYECKNCGAQRPR